MFGVLEGNNFYFAMTENHIEEIPQEVLASSEAKPVDLEELKEEIRKSRQTLLESLNGIPDTLRQNQKSELTTYKTPTKNQSFQMPITTKKQDQRVLFQTATKTPSSKEVVKTQLRMVNNKEIQSVLYEVPQRRSLSPVERPAQSMIMTNTRTNKDISQSAIISPVSRNSLTPTKLKFCYQSKPVETVAYISRKQQMLSHNRKEQEHLKEIVYRNPPSVQYTTVNPIVRTSSPVFVKNPSPPPGQSVVRTINLQPIQNRYVSVNASSLERHRKETTIGCKLQASGQYCRLCDIARSNLKGLRETRFSNIMRTSSPSPIQRVDSDLIATEGESHVSPINASPGKESRKRYLSAQNKSQCRNIRESSEVRRSRREIFGHNFLQEVENRNKVIQSQLVKLNQSINETPDRASKVPTTPVEVLRESSHSRKRIFPEKKVQKSNTFVNIKYNDYKPAYASTALPVRSVSYVQGNPKEQVQAQINQTRSQIRNTSPLVVNERQRSVSPSFQRTIVTVPPAPIRNEKIVFNTPPRTERVTTVSHLQPLVRTVSPIKTQAAPNAPIIVQRIVTPTHKDKVKTTVREVDSGRLQYGLMSNRTQFFKKEITIEETKKLKIPDFDSMEFSVDVRGWLATHRREVEYQAERICSYDLIKRYMTETEISARLHSLIVDQVQPKRWLLTMVDEVYGKLKDRYLPISQ